MVDGVESEGNQTNDKEDNIGDDVNMDAVEEKPNWKPRRVEDPIGPIEIGSRSLFISKEKSDRVTKSWHVFRLLLFS